tara:strand:+ start:813 stop:1019 length:207 start_codon:yes stop_codon:yes gene_type:complete
MITRRILVKAFLLQELFHRNHRCIKPLSLIVFLETVASITKEKDCTMKIKNKELKDKYSEKLEQKLCN